MQSNNPEEIRLNTKELLEISFENDVLHPKEKDNNNIAIVEIQQEDG
jgi:hypothetical protein